MACEDIRQRLATLRSNAAAVEEILPGLQGAGLAVATENLANINADIAEEQANLAECEALDNFEPGVTPRRAFTGRVKEIHCVEAGAEIGDQEPYLIMASVDMLAGAIPIPFVPGVPAVHCVVVGPWSGLRAGLSRVAGSGSPSFWDLDENRRVVASADDVIFLAGLVENDGASPDAIRGAVQNSLKVSLAGNLGRDHDTLADTMRSSMVGAIATFAGLGIAPGHANFDDQIAVHEVVLSDSNLDTIDALGEFEKTVTFTRTKGNGNVADKYTVTFEFAA
jgi:hypothetical protein